jgi:hypothetical protein
MHSLKKKYLSEDTDLLETIEKMGNVVSNENQKILQELQIMATLRNRKSLDSLEKSTIWYTVILAIFALVQIIIMFLQFALDAFTSENKLIGAILVILCGASVLYVMKKLDPFKILKD